MIASRESNQSPIHKPVQVSHVYMRARDLSCIRKWTPWIHARDLLCEMKKKSKNDASVTIGIYFKYIQ